MGRSEGRTSLRAFIGGLDRSLDARAMYEAARRAGYNTSISSVYTARTSLGISKPRNELARTTPPKPAPAPIALPSDEAILEQLILKIGLDPAWVIYKRVAHNFDLDCLAEVGPAALNTNVQQVKP